MSGGFRPRVVRPIVQMNADIVTGLEAALKDAKAGELTCIAIAAAYRGGNTAGLFVEGAGLQAMLGELEIVKGRALEYVRDLNGGEL